MSILTEDMKRVVRDQRLGFIATVCPDGTPNLSPKGTTTVWDDDHLIFGDIRSPVTMANLRHNPAIEINVLDVFLRKGYRFKGEATILTEGPQYEAMMVRYEPRGLHNSIGAIVLVKVKRALPLVSPGYDGGASEDEVRQEWTQYWHTLNPKVDI